MAEAADELAVLVVVIIRRDLLPHLNLLAPVHGLPRQFFDHTHGVIRVARVLRWGKEQVTSSLAGYSGNKLV